MWSSGSLEVKGEKQAGSVAGCRTPGGLPVTRPSPAATAGDMGPHASVYSSYAAGALPCSSSQDVLKAEVRKAPLTSRIFRAHFAHTISGLRGSRACFLLTKALTAVLHTGGLSSLTHSWEQVQTEPWRKWPDRVVRCKLWTSICCQGPAGKTRDFSRRQAGQRGKE